MSEETTIETTESTDPTPETAEAKPGKAAELLGLGKSKLGEALHWIAQTLTKASAGLSAAAAKVDAVGTSLAVTE
ncbi:MAG: hypothetical protein AB7S68_32890 [Polyangiaceae bacterium]